MVRRKPLLAVALVSFACGGSSQDPDTGPSTPDAGAALPADAGDAMDARVDRPSEASADAIQAQRERLAELCTPVGYALASANCAEFEAAPWIPYCETLVLETQPECLDLAEAHSGCVVGLAPSDFSCTASGAPYTDACAAEERALRVCLAG